MVRDQVLPILQGIVPPDLPRELRVIRLAGLGESAVEDRVGASLLGLRGLEVGYCARAGEIEIRCMGNRASLDEAERIVRAGLGEHVFTVGEDSLEEVVVGTLRKSRTTLAVAESCTGGALTNMLTNVPGASEIFLAGYVTYANAAKSDVLGVSPALIEEHGAVSAPVAAAMAEGARARAGVSRALSTTGIAGPGGGSQDKPVGLVFIGLAQADAPPETVKRQFRADRNTFKTMVSKMALDLLRARLTQLMICTGVPIFTFL
jgi:nicotinamide-nucleotide amidase